MQFAVWHGVKQKILVTRYETAANYNSHLNMSMICMLTLYT